MSQKTRILLKLTGNVLDIKEGGSSSRDLINTIIEQLKELSEQFQFGIVIGGGNFFRGSIQGRQLGMTEWAAHTTGMMATIMNSIILKDLFTQSGLETEVLSAIDCPLIASPISIAAVEKALARNVIIIFAGGTGVPYFTTDTNAVIRCSQLGSRIILKATSVDGIYDVDPNKHKDAKLLKSISYDEALSKGIGVMDATAYIMARDHNMSIKIFDIFKPNSIVKALRETDFGSVFYT